MVARKCGPSQDEEEHKFLGEVRLRRGRPSSRRESSSQEREVKSPSMGWEARDGELARRRRQQRPKDNVPGRPVVISQAKPRHAEAAAGCGLPLVSAAGSILMTAHKGKNAQTAVNQTSTTGRPNCARARAHSTGAQSQFRKLHPGIRF